LALTVTEIKELRATALKAYQNALTNESYSTGENGKKNQNIADLKKDFLMWDAKLDAVLAGRGTGPVVKIAMPYV